MSEPLTLVRCLMVDDEPEYITATLELIPESLAGCKLEWNSCNSFSDALKELEKTSYGLVVSDVYADTKKEDSRGLDIDKKIRSSNFVPIIFTSTASIPPDLKLSQFSRFVGKIKPDDLIDEIKLILETGVVQMKERLHAEIDRDASGFLWSFLNDEWESIQDSPLADKDRLYGFIKRRTALSLGRLKDDGKASERLYVDGSDYYIYPPISGSSLRTGQIVRNKTDDSYSVVLTPRCQLSARGDKAPQAKFVLLAPMYKAIDICAEASVAQNKIGFWIRHPHRGGEPEGRYFFLPGLLDMPDMYADLHAIQSFSMSSVVTGFQRRATLDAPFSEALQSQFIKLFSSVGVPELVPESFHHLCVRTVEFDTNTHSIAAKNIQTGKVSVSKIPPNVDDSRVVEVLRAISKHITKDSFEWSWVLGRLGDMKTE